jgi:hypothetical protein
MLRQRKNCRCNDTRIAYEERRDIQISLALHRPLLADRQNDLSDLLVRLEVLICFDDLLKRKCLGNLRFELPALQFVEDVALRPG